MGYGGTAPTSLVGVGANRSLRDVSSLTAIGMASVAAASVAVPLVLTHAHVVVVVTIAFGVVVAVLTAAVDVRSAQLPNRMVTVIFATAMLGAVIDHSLAGALIGAVLYALPFLAIHVARPRRLAFGDVKFAAATGLLVGVMWWPSALLAAAVTCFGLATRRALPSGRRRGMLPAGPAFVAGLLVALWVSMLIRAGGAI